MDFVTALTIFVALTGFPAFLSILINILKAVGWLKDGDAPKVVLWSSIAVFIGVAVLAFTGQIAVLTLIDSQLGALAKVLTYFAAFATELGLTKIFHQGLRGLPFIGFSYTLEEKK